MKTILVAEISGELCMTHEEGYALLELLRPAFDAGGADLDLGLGRHECFALANLLTGQPAAKAAANLPDPDLSVMA